MMTISPARDGKLRIDVFDSYVGLHLEFRFDHGQQSLTMIGIDNEPRGPMTRDEAIVTIAEIVTEMADDIAASWCTCGQCVAESLPRLH